LHAAAERVIVGRTRAPCPKRYELGDAPASVRTLVREVLPRLLEGEPPALDEVALLRRTTIIPTTRTVFCSSG